MYTLHTRSRILASLILCIAFLAPHALIAGETEPGRGGYLEVRGATPDELNGAVCGDDRESHTLEVLKYPALIQKDRVIGVQDRDGKLALYEGYYSAEDGQKIVVPGAGSFGYIPELGGNQWNVRLRVAEGAQLDFNDGTALALSCKKTEAGAERVVLEEGYLSFTNKDVSPDVRYEVETKEGVLSATGARYVVYRHDNKTTYYVTHGTIQITPSNTRLPVFSVGVGNKASVTRDEVMTPRPFSEEELPKPGDANALSPARSNPLVTISVLGGLVCLVGYLVFRNSSRA